MVFALLCWACLTQCMMTPFTGPNLTEEEDAFNFHQSQLRINIECAFGMLVRSWGILWRPMSHKLSKVSRIVGACIRLHNFNIKHRMAKLGVDIDDAAAVRKLPVGYGKRVDRACDIRACSQQGGGSAPRFDKFGRPIDMLEARNTSRAATTAAGKSLRNAIVAELALGGFKRPPGSTFKR